jgi:hypothetical protein
MDVDRITVGIILVFVGLIVYHHAVNEFFYRKINFIWNEHIHEEMSEEFAKNSKSSCLCGCTPLDSMRYWTFLEWVSLWRQ